jgi:hypothetical protein
MGKIRILLADSLGMRLPDAAIHLPLPLMVTRFTRKNGSMFVMLFLLTYPTL